MTLQRKRVQCKQLEEQISAMKNALDTEGQTISPELSNDSHKLFSESDDSKFPPFMKLLWQKQQKYINSSSTTAIRYHPIIIKFCLNLAAKSSSAYKNRRCDSTTGSALLLLSSLRTLYDYKNYIKPTKGFNPDVINDLGKKTASFPEIERYVTIFLDEMKIQCGINILVS